MAGNYLTSKEISDYTINGGVAKVNRSATVVLLMGVLAGVYIALGAIGATTAAHDIANKGLAKLVSGAVFPVGLMLVVLNGADLFTGNSLIIMSTFDKKTEIADFFKNISIVLLGNFIGAVTMAFLQANSSLLEMSYGGFASYTFKVAADKLSFSFTEALILGIICNIFVCAGILMAYSATDVAGKIWGCFFPIFAFTISSSEHVVANMYYVPVAIFAKMNPELVAMSGVDAAVLAEITWGNFFINNVIPVTIGNFIGGVFLGSIYYAIHHKLSKIN
ncbi:MAG: FdhC protein [Epulopiscium sp. Nele67-Bin005]|nr:MAG: FdhC protein [Epulopiscium sp. Nele67-Bin005]